MKCYILILFIITQWKILQTAMAQCIHHPNADQQKQQLKRDAFRQYIDNGWTFKMIDEYRMNTRPERARNLNDVKSRQSKFSGEKSCRKNRNITLDSDIHVQSTCPWYYVIDYDAFREPSVISKAKCSCRHCYKADGKGKASDKCREIYSYIAVIKWRCPFNFTGRRPYYFQYFLDFEAVPVGCCCQRSFEIV